MRFFRNFRANRTKVFHVKRFGTIAPSDETSPANQEEAMAA
jgi:hypothetical protein